MQTGSVTALVFILVLFGLAWWIIRRGRPQDKFVVVSLYIGALVLWYLSWRSHQ